MISFPALRLWRVLYQIVVKNIIIETSIGIMLIGTMLYKIFSVMSFKVPCPT